MRNIRPEEPPPQDWEGFLFPGLGALRTCTGRIRELQNLRPPGDHTDRLCRHAELRAQANAALRSAHACAADGDFRRTGARPLMAVP